MTISHKFEIFEKISKSASLRIPLTICKLASSRNVCKSDLQNKCAPKSYARNILLTGVTILRTCLTILRTRVKFFIQQWFNYAHQIT